MGGLPITWNSVKQCVVALSTCEAKYIAASSAACQSPWISRLIDELMSVKGNSVRILVDNKSALELTKNPVYHSRSKHTDTRHHFIRNCIEGLIKIKYVRTEDQLADLFTKSLRKVKFYEFRAKISVTVVQNCHRLKGILKGIISTVRLNFSSSSAHLGQNGGRRKSEKWREWSKSVV